ncbi:nitroimidazol reductase NimA-like FMN-containing flavoprotein (pyridoxamine 5'-phosphate oxidase superfamily) [Pedobacter sp. UYP30]|uniref:pyridoxamine 5'-phosphate oxidase family protein n=1 Tax=Pedobacter sp. UYP30 TaxID=1756400 RepID=UPI003395B771
MLGELSKREMIDFLERRIYGRLGCSVDGRTYVVPINFVFRNDAIYAHSGHGKKIDMMRENPNVCFIVDDIVDTFTWRSVIIQGVFNELEGEERQQAMQGIIHKITPLTYKPTQEPSHGIAEEERSNVIVYRIDIINITGRFEVHNN